MSTRRLHLTGGPSPFRCGRAGRGVALLCAGTLLLGGAPAWAAVRAGRFSGTTSEGGAVTLTISGGGRAITHFKGLIGYNGKCGAGGGPSLTVAPAAIPIGRSGSFSQPVRLTLHGAVNINDPGRVLGKVSGMKVTGTIEQYYGGKVNKCYVESFTAMRA